MTHINRREFLIAASTGVAAMAGLLNPLGNTVFSQSFSSDSIRQYFESSGRQPIKGIALKNTRAISRIYRARNYAPLWSTNGVSTNTSKSASNKLLNADSVGLEPTKYLGRLLHQLAANPDPEHMLQFELALTDSLYSYFNDLAHGALQPPDAKSSWSQKRTKNSSQTINDFFAGSASYRQTVATLQPDHPRYLRLIRSLERYRKMAAAGGWPRVPGGSTLRRGDRHPRVAILRQRLLASDDLQQTRSFDNDSFDNDVTAGLKRFQKRHGLTTDGLLGAQTLAQLNIPISERIAQLKTNIDRWRWLPNDLGYSNVIVNTAGYELDVSTGGVVATNMKVVIGKPDNKTPIFSDTMEYIVFNPSWYVPKSIVRKLLPNEINNPGWFEQNNYEIRYRSNNETTAASMVNLDADHFVSTYRLRQLPGKNNALGDLKFMFPNRYSVYLHDTNAKSLFDKPQRAFSHGCVRLEKPVELARVLLKADGKSDAEIDSFLIYNDTKKVSLNAPLPVHMTYQTAWVDESGATHFREDIYGHDEHAFSQLKSNKPMYAEAELKALASTDLTIVSNTY